MYYRSAAGTWTYWESGSVVPASSSYQQISAVTPPVPSGATHLSFGLALPGLGTLTTDDYALLDLTP